MKTLISTALLLVIAIALTSCRYNGNTTVNVTTPANGEKGLAPLPGSPLAASGAVNIIISGNTATQDATKSVDAGKLAASAAQAQGGDATGGTASVTTPQPPAE